MTMRTLADKTGTSQQQIDRLEKGRRRLTVDWMQRLSKALECDMTELVPGMAANHPKREGTQTARIRVIGTLNK